MNSVSMISRHAPFCCGIKVEKKMIKKVRFSGRRVGNRTLKMVKSWPLHYPIEGMVSDSDG